jgi:thiazole/oxazole-forming peptide maturase SagC family component
VRSDDITNRVHSDLSEPVSISSGLSVIVISEDEAIVKAGMRSSPSIILRDTDCNGYMGPVLGRLLEGPARIEQLLEVTENKNRNDLSQMIEDLIKRGIISRASENPLEQYLKYLINKSSRLSDYTVTIAGTGQIGKEIASDLAAVGIGKLVLYDGRKSKKGTTSKMADQKMSRGQMTFSKECADFLAESGYSNVETIETEFDNSEAMKRAVSKSDLLLVTLDKPNPRLYYQFNRMALQFETKWIIATIDGHQGYVGPTFIPFHTACYSDYERQMRAVLTSLETYRYYSRYLSTNTDVLPFIGLPSYLKIISSMTALSAIHLLLRNYSFTSGRVLVVDFENMQLDFHDILRLPRCPSCRESIYSRIIPAKKSGKE